MKYILFIVVIVISVLSCNQNAKKTAISQSDTISFNEVLDHFYEERLKLNPIEATNAGDNRYNHLFPNTLTDSFRAKEKDLYTRFKTQISQFRDENLTEDEVLSKAVLEWECDINLQRLKFKQHLTPINQMWTPQLTIGQFSAGTSAQPFKTVKDYDNWLKRLEAYLEWLDTAKKRMTEGIASGHVLPKSLIVKVTPQLKTIADKNLDTHLFYNPIKIMPTTFSEDDKKRLSEAYKNIITQKVIPTYQDLYEFMNTTYLESGRTTSGIKDIPDGKAYYEYSIKLYTTTNMTPDEIHNLGLKEVARILSEMEKVKEEVGFKGDLKSFFDNIRTHKKLMPFTTAKEVLAHFDTIHKTMKPQLKKLFDLTPKTPFVVKQTEKFREASASAQYNPGSIDGTRPGIFYTPIPDPKKYNVLSDEALFLHEAIPGHHYQISLTQENDKLPKFRKTLWYSVYGEGWALYTESLGKELGLYTDPYQYLGMLGMEMHRAIRLVVDTGIHAKGWTREQAIKYSLEHETESEEGIISEIERYMANPGQALSYKIGQLKIKELREKAENTLGERFNIRKFHNQILETGCIPLFLLEEKLEKWINSHKN